MANVEASLPQFERLVVERNHEGALLTAITILQAINGRYGRIDRVAIGHTDSSLTANDAMLAFCTRFAAAFGRISPICRWSDTRPCSRSIAFLHYLDSSCVLHCSYAFTPTKHAIKAGLIRQMRRA